MFERFTERAKRVVVLAQEEARMLDHNYIGTEHVLLGLIHEGEGIPARLLESLGLSLEVVRGWIEERTGRGMVKPSGHIPFTPRAKKALKLSLRESLELGHEEISTEHVLLGLLREMREGVSTGEAAVALADLKIDKADLRRQCLVLMGAAEPLPVDRVIMRWHLEQESRLLETVLLPQARAEVVRLEARRDEITLKLATNPQ